MDIKKFVLVKGIYLKYVQKSLNSIFSLSVPEIIMKQQLAYLILQMKKWLPIIVIYFLKLISICSMRVQQQLFVMTSSLLLTCTGASVESLRFRRMHLALKEDVRIIVSWSQTPSSYLLIKEDFLVRLSKKIGILRITNPLISLFFK